MAKRVYGGSEDGYSFCRRYSAGNGAGRIEWHKARALVTQEDLDRALNCRLDTTFWHASYSYYRCALAVTLYFERLRYANRHK